MRYINRQDGEVFKLPKAGRNAFTQRLACCDCGLVHDIAVIVEGRELYMAAKRNNRATAKRRKKPKGSK
jgi:hypothetical protein